MTRYVALIRGINVGGKNKISMSNLRESFQLSGFTNVSTYINSGNIIFESDILDLAQLVSNIENILVGDFGIATGVAVLSVPELHDAWDNAPRWWGEDPESKHNALFSIAPANTDIIAGEVEDTKPEYEMVDTHKHVIYWSAPLKTFSRTRWSKIVGSATYKKVTIRNFNTVKKLVEITR